MEIGFGPIDTLRALLAGLAVHTLLALPASATTGAGHTGLIAKADNAVNTNLNPAGLTRIQRPEWVGQGLYFSSTSNYAYTSDSNPGTFKNDNDGSTVIPFVYYSRPLTDKLGLGVFVTGNAFSEDLGDSGPSRYLAKEWDLITGSLVANLGYKLTNKLSVGAGASLNYTSFELKSNVYNPEPNIGDGEMKFDDADITIGFSLGTLYEFTPQTRAGLVYRSSIEPEIKDQPSFSGLGPIRQGLIDAGLSVFSQNIDMGVKIPQMLLGGIYHEFDSGSGVSLDGGWVDFSEFGITEVRLGDTTLNKDDSNFQDIYIGTLGYFHQLSDKWQLSVGTMYLSSGIDDDDRTYAFKLDRIWGVGIGAEYKQSDDLIYGLNVNYYDLGDGKTETFVEQTNETINGKYDDHYAIGLDFTVRWIR
jgi:long-chain fatty acid transport protein